MASHENRLYVVRTMFTKTHRERSKVFRTRKAARAYVQQQRKLPNRIVGSPKPATWGPDNVGGKA